MELLLNVAWLMLALPAIWIWRRHADSIHPARGFGRAVPFLILGCVLLMLFPVVSATDDLYPVQANVEESNPRRVVRQLSGDRSGNWLTPAGSVLAQSVSSARVGRCEEVLGLVLIDSLLLLPPVSMGRKTSRAPPSHFV